ncbi:tyrosine-type recombinase/integrase [Bacillus paralicheniformis]|uniref:tyrosine-type recombinase/integrase n=1 Tax=Bacillus paralicheniformis TaxID=1648923 RepID=UPI002867C312|nr:tyrosine-type recombinase/integrase [Bacillus paralicheniformis]WMW46653.1 tyrosine-type recombinase/integrase [Bacillus paralicheniformis]
MHCRQVERKKGKVWECFIDAAKHPVTGKRRQITASAKTKREAIAKLNKKVEKINQFGLLTGTASKITFWQLAKIWLDTVNTSGKKSTHRTRFFHVKRFSKYVSDIAVKDITNKMYQDVINQMYKDGYSLNTIRNAHSVAKSIFTQAIVWGIIKDSPAQYAKIPKEELTIEEIEQGIIEEKYLEHEELNQLLKIVESHGLINDIEMLYTLAFSGMRVGELCALKEHNLDFKKDEIFISKTIYNIDGKMHEYELLTPKTKGSIRRISLDKFIMNMLKKIVSRNKEKKLSEADWHNENFVFTRKNGYPYSPRFVHYRLKRLEKWTTFNKRVNPHIFRHTHTSMLAEMGIDLPSIMARLGHSDEKTTYSIYTHVTKKMKSTVDERISNYIGQMQNPDVSQKNVR